MKNLTWPELIEKVKRIESRNLTTDEKRAALRRLFNNKKKPQPRGHDNANSTTGNHDCD